MESQLLEQIVEKLKTLQEPALREVLNHLDLLEISQAEANEPLLAIAGTLSGLPTTSNHHGFGSWQGQIIMAEDFDEPLEDLKEYME
jgi:Protein of unknown function (DUF2281)